MSQNDFKIAINLPLTHLSEYWKSIKNLRKKKLQITYVYTLCAYLLLMQIMFRLKF